MYDEISGTIRKTGAQTSSPNISELFEFDKRFITSSKGDNEGFQFDF